MGMMYEEGNSLNVVELQTANNNILERMNLTMYYLERPHEWRMWRGGREESDYINQKSAYFQQTFTHWLSCVKVFGD